MPTIPLSKARAGMVLAADAESPDGNYRLAAGTALSDGNIRLLRGWHVQDITVAAEDAAPAAPSLPDAAAAVRARFA
ncbi:MAG TPA: HDOD domain-containing protein, partial [Solidesulfovibrio sp.]|nr:phosphohydrolase [Desulfovibrio sp.]HML62232.1 HDOD domain-containing protein [Solidesulfovibrio sp.]